MQRILNIIDISKVQRISFRNDLNGLRAVAVLSVVFYHAEIALFQGGWLGVDIFFVISGYLISNIIISELNEGTFSFKVFYLRRLKRILPALFFTIFITIPFAYWLLTPKAMTEYVDSITASLFFFANYYFQNLDFYVAESTKVMPLMHTWSLAIEEQYYLLFPVFSLLLFKYCRKYFALIIGISAVISVYINTLVVSNYKFYQLQFRAWELLIGVLIMIVSSNLSIKHLEKIGLPLMIFPIYFFDDSWINDIEPKIISLTGVALIIFSNTKDSQLSKIFSFKIFSLIGLSSYSIYLLHQPIFAFFRLYKQSEYLYFESYTKRVNIISDPPTLNNNIFNPSNVTLSILFLLLIGFLTYRFIELNKSRILISAICFLLVLTFVISQSNNIKVYNERFNPNVLLSNESIFTGYGCWGTFSEWTGNADIEHCLTNNYADRNIVFIGDSSTAAVAKNFTNKRYLKNKFNYLFLTPGSKNVFFSEIDFNNQCENCVLEVFTKDSQNDIAVISLEIHRYIEKQNSIYYTQDYSEGNNSEILFANIEKLSSVFKELIFIEPFPTALPEKPSPVEIVLSTQDRNLDEIYIPYQIWKNNTIRSKQFIDRLTSNIDNLHFLETENIFCSIETSECTFYNNPEIYYIDKYHLTTLGGDKIAKRLVAYIDAQYP